MSKVVGLDVGEVGSKRSASPKRSKSPTGSPKRKDKEKERAKERDYPFPKLADEDDKKRAKERGNKDLEFKEIKVVIVRAPEDKDPEDATEEQLAKLEKEREAKGVGAFFYVPMWQLYELAAKDSSPLRGHLNDWKKENSDLKKAIEKGEEEEGTEVAIEIPFAPYITFDIVGVGATDAKKKEDMEKKMKAAGRFYETGTWTHLQNYIEMRQKDWETGKRAGSFEPAEITRPLRSRELLPAADDKSGAAFVLKLGNSDRKEIYDMINLVNYIGMETLLWLLSARMATIIKGTPLTEMNDKVAIGKRNSKGELVEKKGASDMKRAPSPPASPKRSRSPSPAASPKAAKSKSARKTASTKTSSKKTSKKTAKAAGPAGDEDDE